MPEQEKFKFGDRLVCGGKKALYVRPGRPSDGYPESSHQLVFEDGHTARVWRSDFERATEERK